MKRLLYLILFVVALLLAGGAEEAFAQKSKAKSKNRKQKKASHKISNFTGNPVKFSGKKMYTMIGVSLNSMNYFGDVVPQNSPSSTDFSFTKPNVGFNLTRRIGSRYMLKGSFAWGRLKGDDNSSADPAGENSKYRYTRNVHFRNDIKEVSVVSVVDLFENRGNYLRRVVFTPYVFAGLAVFHHNPKARTPIDPLFPEDEPTWVALQPLGTEGQGWDEKYGKKYSRFNFAVPFGIGVRFRMTNTLDLAVEMGYRYTFTDYIDDVSGNYADPAVFGSNTLARQMADRSAEPIAANTGNVRDLDNLGTGRIYTDAFGHQHNIGFGADGDKRGGSDRDIYVLTGVHLTYVFNTNKRNAKFR